MTFEWSLWYVFVLEPLYLFYVCVYVCLFLKKKKDKKSFFVFIGFLSNCWLYVYILYVIKRCSEM